jgi:hypothetical protein
MSDYPTLLYSPSFVRFEDLRTRAFEIGKRPLVYAWFRANRCLYIGSSKNGLIRVMTHNVIKGQRLKEGDFIAYWERDRPSELERLLQEIYRPIYCRHRG